MPSTGSSEGTALGRGSSRPEPADPASPDPPPPDGRSGSGKTTLLNCIGGLDRPDSGRVHVDGEDVTALDEDGLLRLRRETVGFVFQSFGLVPILSARENVGRPAELSGGQQQRVALARALAARPSLLLADEPTGQAVLQLIRALVDSQHVTALIATHDPALIGLADRVHELSDGVSVERTAPTSPAA